MMSVQAFLDQYADISSKPTEIDDPEWNSWQRFMHCDCLSIASAIAIQTKLPVGRLMKGKQLAHAFIILPTHEPIPDKWWCLDWSGVRTLKSIREELKEGWGRLVFDYENILPLNMRQKSKAEMLRIARTKIHIAKAMRVSWPSVSNRALHNARLRYRDIIKL